MTAEVAVLNRQGIALAADSAVTITYPRGQRKIFNSVNKLFGLSKRAPVGVMVYGGADLTGVPWETIIKSFRSDLGDRRFPHLRDYAEELITFINGHKVMFGPDLQTRQALASVLLQFRSILKAIDTRIGDELESKGSVSDARIRPIVNRVIRDSQEYWNNAAALPGVPRNHAARLRSTFRDEIDVVIKVVFGELPLGPTAKSRLLDIAGLVFTKDLFPDNVSGVVVAGYGEDDYFPSLVSFDMEGVLLNFVKVRENVARSSRIDGENESGISAFAQGDMVQLFMEGIDARFRIEIDRQVDVLLNRIADDVVGGLKLDASATRRFRRSLDRTLEELKQNFDRGLDNHKNQNHVSPIVDAVAYLPKEELASMAETLVSLTSFKRRVTQDAETVGGPIDVAVISKGDGFVWIRRKHYFDPALNHHFFSNFSAPE